MHIHECILVLFMYCDLHAGHLEAKIMHGSMKEDTSIIRKPSNTTTFGSFELGSKASFISTVAVTAAGVAASSS